ncbi:hypothetical protein IAT38_006096 [Cryptococcus sp. DSM 104549]
MRFSRSLACLVGSLFISAKVALADSPWVGCASRSGVASVAGYSSSTGTSYTSDTCITQCTTLGYAYAAWVLVPVLTPACYCISEANYPTAANYLLPSTSITTACTAAVQASIFSVSSTFSYTGCYAAAGLVSGVINTATGVLGTTVTSPDACFALCKSTTAAYFAPYLFSTSLTPRYGCACGDETTVSGIPTVCGQGYFYAYSHPADAAASSLPRKKRNYERIMAQKRSEMIKERAWDCPTGMRACNVEGVAGSWECVDPTSDLESCGGCTFGDFHAGSNSSVATGFDCTAIPGVLRGSVTCSDGRCEAFACKRGWALRDGECTRSLTIQL